MAQDEETPLEKIQPAYGRRTQEPESNQIEDKPKGGVGGSGSQEIPPKPMASTSHPNYPKGIKLAVIVASLATSVFLCALVR